MLKLIHISHRIIDSFPRLFGMKKYTNKTSFGGPEVPKAHAKKISINFMFFYFNNCGNLTVIQS